MSAIRNMLEIAAEYASYKQAAEQHFDSIAADEAEAKLDEIAARFETALNLHVSRV